MKNTLTCRFEVELMCWPPSMAVLFHLTADRKQIVMVANERMRTLHIQISKSLRISYCRAFEHAYTRLFLEVGHVASCFAAVLCIGVCE